MIIVSGLKSNSKALNNDSSFTTIGVDAFKVISDWYHYAILELTYLDHFQPDLKWISNALGITVHEARDAKERLMRLDFLTINEEGRWIDTLGDANNLGNEFTAPAMRKLQTQVLEKAIIELKKSNKLTPELDSKILLGFVLGKNKKVHFHEFLIK